MNTELIEEFNLIYDKTYKDTLKFVISKCRMMEDVSDILQKTYIEVFRYMEKKKIENANGLVKTLAKRQIYKYYFFKKKAEEIELDEENLVKEESFEEDILNKIDNQKIWELVKDENIIIQKILTLHFLNDNTFKEIAEELQLSESTVKTNFYRVMKRLKIKLLKEE